MRESPSILLVEDDEDVRRVTRATLGGAGYTISEASNGRQGLDYVRLSTPDLIILDVMMPEMNGAEFCRALVEDLRRPDIPVLIFSSINEKSGLMKSLAEVALDHKEFLKKPVGPVELKLRVAQMLGIEPKSQSKASAAGKAPAQTGPVAPRASLAPRQSASGEAPKGQLRAAEPSSSAARLRVLIVDDDRDLLAINRFALEKDYDVATAENGLDGLEMLDLFEPDFVLVDYNMPSMNGLEMVELMRRHPRFSQTPAFFLTANQERDLPKQAFDAGGNLFLRKPIEPDKLRRAIAHFVKEIALKPRALDPRASAKSPRAKPAPVQPLPSEQTRVRMAPPAPGKAAEAGDRMRLRPRAPSSATQPEPASAPSTGTVSGRGSEAVRLLLVDHDPTSSSRILQLIRDGIGDGVLHRHCADHKDALANLARWEPDVILYNPRNPGLDGIAFFQLFRIKRMDINVEFAFVGREFMNAELKYSVQAFGREVIDLASADGAILYEIQSMIAKAAGKPRSKRHSIGELQQEDTRAAEQQAVIADREARQAEFNRQRYRQIQSFLDHDV